MPVAGGEPLPPLGEDGRRARYQRDMDSLLAIRVLLWAMGGVVAGGAVAIGLAFSGTVAAACGPGGGRLSSVLSTNIPVLGAWLAGGGRFLWGRRRSQR